MNEESIEFLKYLSKEVIEIEDKLEAVDKLLGSPGASDFTEAVFSTLVDDVIRMQMMRQDLCKFGSTILAGEFGRMIGKRLKEHLEKKYRGY